MTPPAGSSTTPFLCGHNQRVGRQIPLPVGIALDVTVTQSGHEDVPAHQKTNLTELP
jgi:hypothetical protein